MRVGFVSLPQAALRLPAVMKIQPFRANRLPAQNVIEPKKISHRTEILLRPYKNFAATVQKFLSDRMKKYFSPYKNFLPTAGIISKQRPSVKRQLRVECFPTQLSTLNSQLSIFYYFPPAS
jgi:hypothetical protein